MMVLRNRRNDWLVLFVIIGLSMLVCACDTLKLQKPESTQDRIAYARSLASASYKTIGDLKAANSITVDEGVVYFKRVQSAEKDINTAESLLMGGQQSSAATGVSLALTALTSLRDELAKRAPPPK